MTRTLLLADDIRANREILKKILGGDYGFLEAANGQQAMELLLTHSQQISAVLLDLAMPVMDGYGVLKRMQENPALSGVPVIVMTSDAEAESEVKALSLGAMDYLAKPYNPDIVKQRIRNTIKLRETSAAVNALQRDRLTGLYNREAFFDRIPAMIQAREPGYYVLSCFDIDNFKVVNDQYGTQEGDRVLRLIGESLLKSMDDVGGLCCRMTGDNFAGLYPADTVGTRQDVLGMLRESLAADPSLHLSVTFSVGRYVVTAPSLPAGAMYDRAYMAKQSVKGRYDKHVAYFDESMMDGIVEEQRITADMDAAVLERQFEVWYQPQFNHSSGALIGAEALVRWRHPKRGLIAPASFIPVFEKNGFIYELDKYVWEEVCRNLRKWIDQGRSPLAVSVNVSRYDVFRPDLIQVITGLIQRYRIPVELLRLEITESAFAKSTEQIVSVVKELLQLGFTVEVDDFGSGYSSLNTLKAVPAQVVKLDMHFLENDGDSQRGGNILESVVRMAKWLGMSVIAEGVETRDQADFLKSIGCNYVQGYLYAKPMPIEEYEALAKNAGKEERLIVLETVENLNNNTFWDPRSMDTLIFNSYVGAACIFEYHGGKIEMLRANDKFAGILGGPDLAVEDTLRMDWIGCLAPKSRELVRRVLQRSIATGEEIPGEYVFMNIPGAPEKTYLRATMRAIASAGERNLIYCSCENITAQRMAEQSESRIAEQLQTVMDNVNCGITAALLQESGVEFLLTNDRYYQLLGYTREQFQNEVTDPFETVYEEDLERVSKATAEANGSGRATTLEFRVIRRDGSVAWLHCSLSITRFAWADGPVQLCIYTDVTAEMNANRELLDNLPGGAALYEYDGNKLSAIHLNKRYWELVNRKPGDDTASLSVLGSVHPEDHPVIFDELFCAIREKRDLACDIRLRYGAEGYRPFHVVGRIVPKTEHKYAIYASYTPITDEALSIREMLPVALQTVMSAQTDYAFVKDRELRYICCSPAVYRSAGLASGAEIVGKTDYDIMDKDLADQYYAEDRQVLDTGVSLIDQMGALPALDGTERVGSTSKYPVKDSGGNTIGIYGYGRDVTEEREIRSQLELLANNIPGGIAVYEGRPEALDKIRLTYFSDGFCKLFGYARAEYEKLAGRNPMGLVLSEDLPGMLEQVRLLVRDNTPMDCIYRAKAKDGGLRWVNVKAVLGEPRGDNLTVNAVFFDVTDRQEAVERLRMSEESNRIAMRHGNNVLCRYDVDSRVLTLPGDMNPIFELPARLEDVPYGPVREGRISVETAKNYIDFYENIRLGEPAGAQLFQRMTKRGWRWIEAHFDTIFSGGGKPVSAVISFHDVTEQMEKEAVFKKWQQSLRDRPAESYTLFRCNLSKDTALDSVEGELLSVHFSDKSITFDQRTADYVGQRVYDEDRGRYFAFLHADSLLANYYRGKRSDVMEYRELTKEGGYRWLRLSVELVEYPNSTDVEAYLMYENIDAQKRAELLAIERAETDPLTGILNRTAFIAKAEALLAGGSPHAQHALLMMDIDGFKLVNDVFGHAAGDQELMEIAASMRTALRRGDLLGRLGGDEFVILLADIPGDTAAAGKARQICALTRKAFSLEVQVSGSIGIAICPRDGTDFDTLYKKADAALYHVKGSGKDSFAFYHEDMEDQHLEPVEYDGDGENRRIISKKRRMLIVDDNQIDFAVLSNLFNETFIIEKARDGNSALIRLRHYGAAISVVLLDLVMPGMDGFAVLEKMQASADLRSIPVVVVSGAEDPETSLKAIRSGASDFVNKPVDPDLLRIRVQSAVSKAENERLRAQNSLLEYQNSEILRYKTALERSGMVVVEYDWINGGFVYDPAMSAHLMGTYDGRKLWRILLSDMVADTLSVKNMQQLVHKVAEDGSNVEESIRVRLKAPDGTEHWFTLTVYRKANEFGLTDKLLLVFRDQGPALVATE